MSWEYSCLASSRRGAPLVERAREWGLARNSKATDSAPDNEIDEETHWRGQSSGYYIRRMSDANLILKILYGVVCAAPLWVVLGVGFAHRQEISAYLGRVVQQFLGRA